MKKIECLKNHRLLWNEIIRLIDSGEIIGIGKFQAVDKLWPNKKIMDRCWACEYNKMINKAAKFSCSEACLLTTRTACLDGKFTDYINAIDSGDMLLAKIHAEQIRDTPMRPNLEIDKNFI